VNLSGYLELLRDSRIRHLFVVAFFARMPPMAAPLAFTLLVVKHLDGTYTQAGIIAASTTLGAAIGAPWRGRRIDRIGLRRAVVPSITMVAVLYPVAVVAPFWLLVPTTFLMGLFLIPIFSVMRQSLSVMVEERQRRTAFSADSVVTEASFIIGPAIGVLIVTQAGAVAALSFIGACEVIAGVVLLWLNPPTRSADPAMSAVDPDVPAAPTTWMSVPIAFLFLIAAGSVFALYATDLGIVAELEDLHNTGAIAGVYALWGGASLLGGLLYGALPRSVRPTYLLLALGVATIPIGLAETVPTLAIAVVPAGFLCAPTLTAASEWLADLTPEDRRGEAMGWFGTSHTVGAAVAGPVIGTAIDGIGPWGGFVIGGTIAATIAMISWVGQLLPAFRPQPVSAASRGEESLLDQGADGG